MNLNRQWLVIFSRLINLISHRIRSLLSLRQMVDVCECRIFLSRLSNILLLWFGLLCWSIRAPNFSLTTSEFMRKQIQISLSRLVFHTFHNWSKSSFSNVRFQIEAYYLFKLKVILNVQLRLKVQKCFMRFLTLNFPFSLRLTNSGLWRWMARIHINLHTKCRFFSRVHWSGFVSWGEELGQPYTKSHAQFQLNRLCDPRPLSPMYSSLSFGSSTF